MLVIIGWPLRHDSQSDELLVPRGLGAQFDVTCVRQPAWV